ncbi:MAG: hypothetical protein KC457_18735 [Myxococcales bacterium]|nr:hypothetical protein [Myxococcales bacterium]
MLRSSVSAGCSRLIALTLASALALIGPTAAAAGLDPETAEAKRKEVSAGLPSDPRMAAGKLRAAAQELGDPELFLEAADVLAQAAKEKRDLNLVAEAMPDAQTARDIAIYLADERNYDATDWHPVSRDRADALVSKADRVISEIQALEAEIEDERRRAEEEKARLAAGDEDEGKKKRERKPGTGLIAGGAAALVVGAAGIGLLGAGLAKGSSLQREADGLDLPTEQPRLDELDRMGAQANTFAYVGGALGAVGVGVGVALIVVGVKKRKQAGPSAEAMRLLPGGYVDRNGGGLSLQGRF